MLKIYNTLTHTVEGFKPINPPNVGMYSCGPTVYDYQHIGHMRRYVGDDILIRVLMLNDYKVHHVMNITDVGHLTSDADSGEDKMEKGAKKFGKSVWDIAKMFEKQFKDSCQELNIELPKDLMHATDYIKDQIELIQKLEEKGYTYKTVDGVYFDTSKFKDYFRLSRQNPDELRAGVRVDLGEKKNITDFALWKLSPADEKRQMEWESPWAMGFPGWHIECSAMSMKALGESFDIHTGGIDHINIHHTNEIAQSEAATGKPFVNYWVHHNFLVVDGQKMSKSLENFYTVQDVIKRGFNPLALRYLYLQTHYRQEMNFTFEALEAAQNGLNKLWDEAQVFGAWTQQSEPGSETSEKVKEILEQFKDAVNDDLNMSKALSVLHMGLKEVTTGLEKLQLLEETDVILGLDFKSKGIDVWTKNNPQDEPSIIRDLKQKREELRKEKKFEEADKIREKIIEMGYKVEDN